MILNKPDDWTSSNKQFQTRLKQEPETVIDERTRACRHCERDIMPTIKASPFQINRPQVKTLVLVVPRACGCEAEIAYLRREADRLEHASTEQEWQNAIKRAGLVGWLADATFDTYIARKNWSDTLHVKGRVKAYAYALTNGGLNGDPWLMLHGGYGTGKSHLAAAVVRQWLDGGRQGAYFRVWAEYLDRIKATFGRPKWEEGEREEDITRELQSGQLVVIDDIDKQPATDWAKRMLFVALNHRYNAKLPTILTFNYGPDDIDPNTAKSKNPDAPGRLALVEYLGEAVLDRLIGDAFDTIEFNGPSYRSGVVWDQAA